MIAIVDYGCGNVRSVQNMLSHVGFESVCTSSASELQNATKYILPGVGHFDYGMKKLRESLLEDLLREEVVVKGKSLLGICLGAQLLTRRSEEGQSDGLGWIPADVKRFNFEGRDSNLPVPHMGWAETTFVPDANVPESVRTDSRFYYVHSYHIVCDYQENELSHADYGFRFVSGIRQNNIVGVQFHPEKSHKFGKAFLEHFAKAE